MKLYVTETSAYARLVRVVILEKRLEDRVEVIAAQTRQSDSSYYGVNPSGRVPHLVRDDGVGIEESALICSFLDQLDGRPILEGGRGADVWEIRRLEAWARSLLDGLAVWGRELQRPERERSQGILAHEAQRAERLGDLWEREIERPLMRGVPNIAQLTLACALGLEARNPQLHWRPGRPRLAEWFDEISARPSLAATRPPAHPECAWRELRSALEAERDRVRQEILEYPAPIPACDAQYNHLLDARRRVARELGRMEERGTPASLDECRRFLDELAAEESLLDETTERALRVWTG
jgi:glutathione S-transferase